jgi:nucleotide-binding universal stress UspA family protein
VLDARDSQDVIAAPGRPGGYVATLATRGKVTPESPTVIVDRGRQLEAARVNTEDALRERASNYLPGLPVGVHAEFAEDAAACITKFARDQEMSFIVMSTHGRSGLGQALLGSVAGQVVHTATVPVILVGPHVQP